MSRKEPEAQYEPHTVMLSPEQWIWLEKLRRENGYRSISEAIRALVEEAIKNE